MKKLTLNIEELTLDTFASEDRKIAEAKAQALDTQQFRCTYFCTYSACTGLPC